MANFVMSMARSLSVSHPVELAAGPFCHYHYSNLTKVLRHWQIERTQFRTFIQDFISPPRYLADGKPYYALTHDVTKLLKAHSPCLKDRQYVQTANNVIPSNRPTGIGYPVSALHFGAEGGWCPPLALQRLDSTADTNAVAVERYDVEPYYHFAKNRLLMDKLQTPEVGHFDPWLRMVQITSRLLFTAGAEIGQVSCPVWQKYLPKNKTALEQPGVSPRRTPVLPLPPPAATFAPAP